MRKNRDLKASLGALAGTTAMLAAIAVVFFGLRAGAPWLQVVAPILLTLSSIGWLRALYLWQRPIAYKHREKRRKLYPAETLEIPDGVKKPEQYDGGRILHEAQWKYIGHAVEAQGKFFANGILVAILPALALFLLSFQLLALPAGRNWSDVGLIISEIACLMLLIFIALRRREPTAEWIENRLRTELFRREQYLLLAGVGPYLSRNPSAGAEEALRRRGEIESADRPALLALVPMQDRSGVTWIEALHHLGAARLAMRSDLLDRIESYLYFRIGKQLLWFSNEIRDLEENDQIWTSLLTLSSLAAAAVAGFHASFLYNAHIGVKPPDLPGHSETVIGPLAIVLPPLAIACIGIRSMYNFRGRKRTYSHQKGALRGYRGALEALIREAKQASPDGIRSKIEMEFRALALRTEQSLSHEIEQWMLLMERDEHELT